MGRREACWKGVRRKGEEPKLQAKRNQTIHREARGIPKKQGPTQRGILSHMGPRGGFLSGGPYVRKEDGRAMRDKCEFEVCICVPTPIKRE